MGVFSVPLEIANLDGHEFIVVEAMVDTGSSYTVVGEDLLNGLGIRRTTTRRFELGDDSVVEYDMGNACLRLEGEEMAAPVVFGPPGVTALLGATTLQIFHLAADSTNERLLKRPPLRARPF